MDEYADRRVEGTRPIFVSIKSITTESGDAEKMWEVLNVSGDGTFSMPVYSDVPVGRYQISLTFTNEGYTQDVNNWFHDYREISTLIVLFKRGDATINHLSSFI